MGKSKNNPHLTPWLSSQQIAGLFEEILAFYPLGIFWVNWWVLFEFTQTLPAGYNEGELVGTFKKHPEWACQVSSEQTDGYFLKVPSMDLLGKVGANCFRTHNELTMYLLGK